SHVERRLEIGIRRHPGGQKPDILLNAAIANFTRHQPARCHLANGLFANGSILLGIACKLSIADVLDISMLSLARQTMLDSAGDFPLTLRPPLNQEQFGELDLERR